MWSTVTESLNVPLEKKSNYCNTASNPILTCRKNQGFFQSEIQRCSQILLSRGAGENLGGVSSTEVREEYRWGVQTGNLVGGGGCGIFLGVNFLGGFA